LVFEVENVGLFITQSYCTTSDELKFIDFLGFFLSNVDYFYGAFWSLTEQVPMNSCWMEKKTVKFLLSIWFLG